MSDSISQEDLDELFSKYKETGDEDLNEAPFYAEKRAFQRAKFRGFVYFHECGNRAYKGIGRDISEAYLSVETENEFAEGEVVELSLNLNLGRKTHAVESEAVVVRRHFIPSINRSYYVFKFASLEMRSSAVVREYVKVNRYEGF